MGLSFLFRLFTPRPDGGLFGYLQRRDDNKTHIKLVQERRVTSREVIGQLGPGDEYQESTPTGSLVIRKAGDSQRTLVVLSAAGGEQEQVTEEGAGLPGQPPRSIDQPDAFKQPQGNVPGCIGEASQPRHQDDPARPPAAP